MISKSFAKLTQFVKYRIYRKSWKKGKIFISHEFYFTCNFTGNSACVFVCERRRHFYVEMEFIMLICLEEINLNKEFFRKKLEHSLLKGQLSKSGKWKGKTNWSYLALWDQNDPGFEKKSFFLVVPLYSGSHKQYQRQFPLLLCPYTTCVVLPHQSVAVIAVPSSESWNTKLLIVFLLAWMLGIENCIGPTSSSSNPLLA